MSSEIPLYQVKATLSALVREVRERGASYTITVHGEPVAELRALGPRSTDLPLKLDERIRAMEALGLIRPATVSPQELANLPPMPHIPGAYQRWLDERE